MFAHPEWFLLLAVLALLGWQARHLRLEKPLRATTLFLLTLALVDVRIGGGPEDVELWILVDRSASAESLVQPRLAEWEGLIRQAQGSGDVLRRVDFATSVVERTAAVQRFEGRVDETNLGLALQLALNRRDPDKSTRILALTDGYATDALDRVAVALREANVPVDYRLASFDATADFAVAGLIAPPQVQAGEPFLIEARVSGPAEGQARYVLERNGQPIGQGTVATPEGTARLRLSTRAGRGGADCYSLRIETDEADPRPGNNRFESWVEVSSGPRIVLLTRYENAPLAPLLRQSGMDLNILTNAGQFQPGALTGARLVVLHDVPANVLTVEDLEAIDFFVRVQGGSLLMLGGKFSYGSGGYFDSPLEEVMPVSVELKDEHRRLSTAMAIVMDRSGSMSATVGPGQTKMDLANSGAAETARLLGGSDLLTVFAVDSEAHEVVPLIRARDNLGEIERRVRGITSMGGGIFVYNGLKTAWDVLKSAPGGQRHVILFADAADAEQPDQYQSLLAEMASNATTVSVIGLGTRSDADAAFLEDIATRGGGRVFFSRNASDLPSIFAQETVAVARSTFVEEQTGVEPTAGWLELASTPLEWPEAVDGYNLTYLKEGATAAAFTRDEYAAPLLAFWNKGAGRAAAVTFPLAGPFSERAREWPQAGDFVQTLARWLAGEAVPDGLALRTELEGTELRVDLFYDDAWQVRLAKAMPELYFTDGGIDAVKSAIWERFEPGRLRARVTLPTDQPVRGVVRFGAEALPFGPVVVGSGLEWRTPPPARRALIDLSRSTGGTERVNLADAWEAPPARSRASIRLWLLLAALLLFCLDAADTRLGLLRRRS